MPSGKPEKHRQRSVDFFQRAQFEFTKRCAGLVARNRVRFIDHDLRRSTKAVLRRRRRRNAEDFDRAQLSRHGQDRDGRMKREEVGLNHQSGPRFTVGSRQDNRNQLAAFHTHPSVSATSAIHASISASWGSFASERDSCAHFFWNVSEAVSGSHSCTGFNPAARSCSRCLRTRSVIAEPMADPALHETYYTDSMFHATSCGSLI